MTSDSEPCLARPFSPVVASPASVLGSCARVPDLLLTVLLVYRRYGYQALSRPVPSFEESSLPLLFLASVWAVSLLPPSSPGISPGTSVAAKTVGQLRSGNDQAMPSLAAGSTHHFHTCSDTGPRSLMRSRVQEECSDLVWGPHLFRRGCPSHFKQTKARFQM